MGITDEGFRKTGRPPPAQRGNAKHDGPKFLSAVLCVAENGRRWRGPPKERDSRDSVHTGAGRRAKTGVPGRVFPALQKERIAKTGAEHLSPGGTSTRLRPRGRTAGSRGTTTTRCTRVGTGSGASSAGAGGSAGSAPAAASRTACSRCFSFRRPSTICSLIAIPPNINRPSYRSALQTAA
jgi:hypothetical protein